MANTLRGFIYRAFNKETEKSYIGQSQTTLANRIKGHYHAAKKGKYKFANALRFYPKSSWIWSILAEVDLVNLDEAEIFFIQDFDTFKHGYNSTRGGKETELSDFKCNHTVYEVYHPEYGHLKGTKRELMKIHSYLTHVPRLASSEQRKHIKGWILAEYKDSYEEVISTRNRNGLLVTLAHEEYGTHTLLQSDFVSRFGLSYSCISGLISKRRKIHKGWRLVSLSEELLKGTAPTKLEASVITLCHKKYGEHSLTRKEFSHRFDLDIYALSDLEKQKQKTHKGWSLPNANTSTTNPK